MNKTSYINILNTLSDPMIKEWGLPQGRAFSEIIYWIVVDVIVEQFNQLIGIKHFYTAMT